MNSLPNDMKMIIPKGCNNAPRKQIVIDFTVGILTQQSNIIEEYTHESIIWHRLKEQIKLEGLSSLMTTLQGDKTIKVDCLEIDQVITHGKSASINGVLLFADGSKVDFCDVYTFSSAAKSGKVKEVKSYRI